MDELSKKQLAEITAKSAGDLTEADAAFLRARRSYLTEEQCATFAAALDYPSEPAPTAEPQTEEAPAPTEASAGRKRK
jgi:uncharacterized protein (DUF1778 family)